MVPYVQVMNCLVWLCIFPYDPLWSCMVFEILNSPIALLCPVRYQILADIESFAFLFVCVCLRGGHHKGVFYDLNRKNIYFDI